MAMRLSVRWKKDRRLQFSLMLFSGRRSELALKMYCYLHNNFLMQKAIYNMKPTVKPFAAINIFILVFNLSLFGYVLLFIAISGWKEQILFDL